MPIKRSQHSRRDDKMPGKAIAVVGKVRSFVLYGPSGTGKTTLAATFPKPLLLLDIRDEGTDSVSDVDDIECRSISSFEEYEDMHAWLLRHPDKFKTVVTDTLSQLQEMVMREMKGDKVGKQIGKGSMTMRDFGEVTSVMKDWIIHYRDLTQEGINPVFIAQDRIFKSDEDDDRGDIGEIAPEVGPALMPSVAKVLNASVSIIGNTLIRERVEIKEVRGKKVKKPRVEYCLRIGPSSVYRTKVRKPRGVEVPSFIVDPTYDDIMEIIKGE